MLGEDAKANNNIGFEVKVYCDPDGKVLVVERTPGAKAKHRLESKGRVEKRYKYDSIF